MRSFHGFTRTQALGVVVPVHDEEDLLDASLESLSVSLGDVRDCGVTCEVVIVLDSCVDLSARVVAEWQRRHARRDPVRVTRVNCDARNVGVARGAGCAAVLGNLRDVDPANIWIATTDADSKVPRRWLRAQLLSHEAGYDIWAGRVRVTDWSIHRRVLQTRWQLEYESELKPVHGANLGFNAACYLAAGGFAPLPSGEDRALVRAMTTLGANPFFDDSLRVVTSARRLARAPEGFAHALNLLEASPSPAE